MQIELGPAQLTLLPDRAVHWPAQSAVLVADVHLGKDQVFRRQGVAVPAGVLDQDLSRLSSLVREAAAKRLLILGDWVHAQPEPGEPWADDITAWCAAMAPLKIDLVLGNHDRDLDPWLQRWGMQGHSDELELGGLKLQHEWTPDTTGPGLSGHLHPGVRIRSARENLRLPAFLRSSEHLVLPAFGRFTGLMEIEHFPATERYVTTGRRVLKLP